MLVTVSEVSNGTFLLRTRHVMMSSFDCITFFRVQTEFISSRNRYTVHNIIRKHVAIKDNNTE